MSLLTVPRQIFIFDDIRFESTRFGAVSEIDSIEGNWNTSSDEGPDLGYNRATKKGYSGASHRISTGFAHGNGSKLEELGIEIEAQHHEVATAGQSEIDIHFKPLLQMADQLMWFKYVLKNVAYRHNHTR